MQRPAQARWDDQAAAIPGKPGSAHRNTASQRHRRHPTKKTESPELQASQREAALHNLQHYADQVLKDPAYRVESLIQPDIKTGRPLGTFDCIFAPCRDTCATHQDIPEYMLHTSRQEFKEAHGVILRTNPSRL